jgi:hypothetical protein
MITTLATAAAPATNEFFLFDINFWFGVGGMALLLIAGIMFGFVKLKVFKKKD